MVVLLRAALPQPQELRSVTIGGSAGAQEGQALTTLVAQMMALVGAMRPEGEPATGGQVGHRTGESTLR